MRKSIAALSLLTISLAGCATPATVAICERSADFAASSDKAFRIVPAGDQATSLTAAVQARMSELGYAQSENPAFLVEVATASRPGRVGAYVPQNQQSQQWLEVPSPAHQGNGNEIRKITIRITESKSKRLVYKGYVAKALSIKEFEKQQDGMIRALLRDDPKIMTADPARPSSGLRKSSHCE